MVKHVFVDELYDKDRKDPPIPSSCAQHFCVSFLRRPTCWRHDLLVQGRHEHEPAVSGDHSEQAAVHLPVSWPVCRAMPLRPRDRGRPPSHITVAHEVPRQPGCVRLEEPDLFPAPSLQESRVVRTHVIPSRGRLLRKEVQEVTMCLFSGVTSSHARSHPRRFRGSFPVHLEDLENLGQNQSPRS